MGCVGVFDICSGKISGWFRVVSARFGWFRLVPSFSIYHRGKRITNWGTDYKTEQGLQIGAAHRKLTSDKVCRAETGNWRGEKKFYLYHTCTPFKSSLLILIAGKL